MTTDTKHKIDDQSMHRKRWNTDGSSCIQVSGSELELALEPDGKPKSELQLKLESKCLQAVLRHAVTCSMSYRLLQKKTL